MIKYAAKIKYDKSDDCYLVEFPDLLGCVTNGETVDEARKMAIEALTGYLDSIDLRNMDIPEPSRIKGKSVYYISPEPKTAFAVWMKLNRKKKKLSQKKAAEMLGVSVQAYQKYENPKQANPTLTTLIKIENVFNEQILV
jgi:antitoxin HicB